MKDNHEYRNLREKLFVKGSDSIIFPFKSRLKLHSAYAKFVDAESVCFPGCNPLIHDTVSAEVIILPDHTYGVKVTWSVTNVREIAWHVIEYLS